MSIQDKTKQGFLPSEAFEVWTRLQAWPSKQWSVEVKK